MLGETGSGRNPEDEVPYDGGEGLTPQEIAEIDRVNTEKRIAKIEALKGKKDTSVIPNKAVRDSREGKKNRIPVASSFRAKKAAEPHPTTTDGEKKADTEIKKSLEQKDAEKRLQQIIDNFIFIGEFRLEKSQKTEGNFFFELFSTRGEQKTSILKCKNSTFDEIRVALEFKMRSSFKVKKVE
jgi:hypothetical protein